MEFRCRDVGFQCDYVAHGNTEDEIMRQAMTHGQKAHGIRQEDVNEDLKRKIRAATH
jgi:predicted small metal-binding protein